MTKPDVHAAPGFREEPAVASETLAELVYRDDLTRIRNRRFFFKYLREEIGWSDPAAGPVSLLMIDLDDFKKINDRHGHLQGDQALIHVSEIFREHVGDGGVIVRYAGDEFAVVLPGRTRPEAREFADSLLDEVRRRTVALPGGKGILALTLSIGVATFPEDGRKPEALIESADRALYLSKRQGRNRVSVFDARAVDETAQPSPLERLPCPKLIGRGAILERFRELLARSGGSRDADAPMRALLLLRGGVGTGKTRLLAAFREVAAQTKATSLSAALQERDARQPFSGIAALVSRLWRKEGGAKIREILEADELSALRSLLVDGKEPPQPPQKMASALGSALVRILGATAAPHGRLILLDDLQFVDRETLDLLLRVLDCSETPLLVAASVRDEALSVFRLPENLQALLEWVPARGASRYDVALHAFSEEETRDFLSATFPGLAPQDAAVQKLAAVSGGNPLFLDALARHLITINVLRRSKRGFEMASIADLPLPPTLDEAMRASWTGIDGETERVIESAAVIGSRFDLDLLRGVTGLRESEILEFLDRAAGRRLLRSEDPGDPDAFVFESNRFREMAEKATPDERRAELHERIARSEENRHRTGIEAIIGRLAYHYGRSRNRDKATYYGAALDRFRGGLTPRGGIVPKAARARIQEADVPLGEREMSLMRDVFRFFSAAIKNRTLYPPGSRMITTSLEDLRRAMGRVFETCAVFTISSAHEDLVVNGVTIDPRRFVAGAREFLDLLKNFHIRSLTVTREVDTSELEGFIDIVSGRSEPVYDPEFWDRRLDEKGIHHLSVDQRLYVVAGAALPGIAAESGGASELPPTPPWTGDPTLASALEQWIREMGVAPDLQASIEQWTREAGGGSDLPARLIAELAKPEPQTRREAVRLLRGVLTRLASKVDASWMKATEDAVLARFAAETDPAVIGELGGLIADLAQHRLRRGEGGAAARLVQTLRERAAGGGRSLGRAGEVRERLKDLAKGPAFELLAADLASGDPKRLADATAVIRSMGEYAVEALIRLIQSREDLRQRQVVAEQLRELGERAIADVRRALGPGTPEHELRRVIGIVDLLGADFTTELKTALLQPSRSVRQEAAQVLTRLPGEHWALFLEPLAHPDRTIAVEALMQLGKLRRREAVDAVLERMQDGGEEDVLYEGCMTLGKIADPRALPALERYLNASRIWLVGKRHTERVRYAAAWALSQLGSPEAKEALRRAASDKSAMVRAFVQKAVEGG